MGAVTVDRVAGPVRLFDDPLLPTLDAEDLTAEPVEVRRVQPDKRADDGLVDVGLPAEPEPERMREVFPGDSPCQRARYFPGGSTDLVEVGLVDPPAARDLALQEVNLEHHVRHV